MALSSEHDHTHLKMLQLREEQAVASQLAASVLQSAWRLHRATAQKLQDLSQPAPIDGTTVRSGSIARQSPVRPSVVNAGRQQATNQIVYDMPATRGAPSINRHTARWNSTGRHSAAITMDAERSKRLATHTLQSWWRAYLHSPMGRRRRLIPHDAELRHSRPPELLPARGQADRIPCSPVSVEIASARTQPHQSEPNLYTSIPSSSLPQRPPLPQLEMTPQQQLCAGLLTEKHVKRCRAAAAASPAMAMLWLRESEVAAMLDALGLPLNPQCNIDLRERVSAANVCLPLRDAVVRGGVCGGRSVNATVADLSTARVQIVDKIANHMKDLAGDHCAVGDAAYTPRACCFEMANALSTVALRVSLMASEAPSIGASYGKKALKYLTKLIQGPKGGMRVQDFLLNRCDRRVIEWSAVQVQEFLLAAGMPDNGNTLQLAPESGLDLLQQTMVALNTPNRTNERKDEYATASSSAELGSPITGLLGGGTKPSVLRKRLMFHCATVGCVTVWQDTEVMPIADRRAPNAEGVGDLDNLQIELSRLISREVQARNIHKRADQAGDGLTPTLLVVVDARIRSNINEDSATHTFGGTPSNVPQQAVNEAGGGNASSRRSSKMSDTKRRLLGTTAGSSIAAIPVATTPIIGRAGSHEPIAALANANSSSAAGIPPTAASRSVTAEPSSISRAQIDQGSHMKKESASGGRPSSAFSYTGVNGKPQDFLSPTRTLPSVPSGRFVSADRGIGAVSGSRTRGGATSQVAKSRTTPISTTRVSPNNFTRRPTPNITTMADVLAREERPLYRDDAAAMSTFPQRRKWYGEGRVLGGSSRTSAKIRPETATASTQVDTLLPTPVIRPDYFRTEKLQQYPTGRYSYGALPFTVEAPSQTRSRVSSRRRPVSANSATTQNEKAKTSCHVPSRGDVPLRRATIYFGEPPPPPSHRDLGSVAIGSARRNTLMSAPIRRSSARPWRPAGVRSRPMPLVSYSGFKAERNYRNADLSGRSRQQSLGGKNASQGTSALSSNRDEDNMRRYSTPASPYEELVRYDNVGHGAQTVLQEDRNALGNGDSSRQKSRLRASDRDQSRRVRWSGRTTGWRRRGEWNGRGRRQAEETIKDFDQAVFLAGRDHDYISPPPASREAQTAWESSEDQPHENTGDGTFERSFTDTEENDILAKELSKSPWLLHSLLHGKVERERTMSKTQGHRRGAVNRSWSKLKSPISIGPPEGRATAATNTTAAHGGGGQTLDTILFGKTSDSNHREPNENSGKDKRRTAGSLASSLKSENVRRVDKEKKRMLAAAAAERRAAAATTAKIGQSLTVADNPWTVTGEANAAVGKRVAPGGAPIADKEHKSALKIRSRFESGISECYGTLDDQEHGRNLRDDIVKARKVVAGLDITDQWYSSTVGVNAHRVAKHEDSRAGHGGSRRMTEEDASLPAGESAWDVGEVGRARKLPPSVVDDAKAWVDKVKAGLCW